MQRSAIVSRFRSILALFGTIVATYLFPLVTAAQSDFVTCTGTREDPCSACDLVTMINTIIGWLIAVVVIIATMLIVYAGFKLVISRGDVAGQQSAKAIMTNTIIGLGLLLLSWVLVDTIMKILLDQEREIGVWNEVDCDPQPRVDVASGVLFAEASFEDDPVPAVPRARQVSTGPYTPGDDGTVPDPNATTTDINDLDITVNDATNPLFDCTGTEPMDRCSDMLQDGAVERMQETLAGPFATLQENFGQPLVINDALGGALSRTTGERTSRSAGSRHMYGDALDISLAGMSNADRIRLFEEAQAAGFTGFGFGNNILHMDRGTPRGWDYDNSTYGGVSTQSLINRTR